MDSVTDCRAAAHSCIGPHDHRRCAQKGANVPVRGGCDAVLAHVALHHCLLLAVGFVVGGDLVWADDVITPNKVPP